MVSGGLSVGFGIRETAIKEAAEEASIPQELAEKIVSAGCVSFFFESERGLFPNTEFVYDLELPMDFVPVCNDGEVSDLDFCSSVMWQNVIQSVNCSTFFRFKDLNYLPPLNAWSASSRRHSRRRLARSLLIF